MFQFIARKLMERQLKDMPAEQRGVIMAMFEKNPEFFKKMSEEIKAKKKAGKSDQQASLEVMMSHRQEMQRMAQEAAKNR